MKTITMYLLCTILLTVPLPMRAYADKANYGGFSPDSLQVFYDYIHGQEMMAVRNGSELHQAIEEIPIQLEAAIDLNQEKKLREWLYDFMVTFSESGSDSLAAEFYLREGVNNPRMLEKLKDQLLKKGYEDVDSPFQIFRAGHNKQLKTYERDYYIENVSFHDSVFRIFEMQGQYEHYAFNAHTQGMLPRGKLHFSLNIQPEIERRLREGEKRLFVEVMFIIEEPEVFSIFPVPGRTPSFFRLVWDEEKQMWRHLEVFFSAGVPQSFLFNVM